MRTLEGKTALVVLGGGEPGRAIALALAARGVHVLVTGPSERSLGETVGEVVHGGGKARHLVGDTGDAPHLARAVERTIEVFGSLDIVVATHEAGPMSVECTFEAALPRMTAPGRLFSLVPPGAPVLRPGAAAMAPVRSGIVALAIDAATAVEPEAVGALLVLLCGPAAARLGGLRVGLGAP